LIRTGACVGLKPAVICMTNALHGVDDVERSGTKANAN